MIKRLRENPAERISQIIQGVFSTIIFNACHAEFSCGLNILWDIVYEYSLMCRASKCGKCGNIQFHCGLYGFLLVREDERYVPAFEKLYCVEFLDVWPVSRICCRKNCQSDTSPPQVGKE